MMLLSRCCRNLALRLEVINENTKQTRGSTQTVGNGTVSTNCDYTVSFAKDSHLGMPTRDQLLFYGMKEEQMMTMTMKKM
mmetsp:Transcript_19539/g.25383  ORF Transcript_19539/g.25383 Transcript_19539/m.25383 type:complete len:80 (+) Transcript_19539:137-376(+)